MSQRPTGAAFPEVPPSGPRSGVRNTSTAPPPPRSPLAGDAFRTLRELRDKLGRGGIPPLEKRTAEDEARIGAFCVLQELSHILDQYRRAVEDGSPVHFVVREHGRRLGKTVLEITIEAEIVDGRQ